MPKYVGQQCTSCRVVFTENDDIVVCPECGSPYHRDCYKNEGKCVNALLHENGHEWQPVITQQQESQTQNVCPNCGTKNVPEAVNCKLCGVPFENKNSDAAQNQPPQQQAYWQNAQNPQYGQSNQYGQQGQFQGQQGMGMPPFINVQTISADTPVDIHTAGEYTRYVGSRFFYFVPKFMKFANTRSKVSFNVSAFFFTFMWFFYRKMPVQGIIVAAATVIASLSSFVESAARFNGTYEIIEDNPRFLMLSSICMLLSFGIKIVCALFADRMYHKKAKNDISSIKATITDPTYQQIEFQRRGGTSVGMLILSTLAVIFLSSFVLLAFI